MQMMKTTGDVQRLARALRFEVMEWHDLPGMSWEEIVEALDLLKAEIGKWQDYEPKSS